MKETAKANKRRKNDPVWQNVLQGHGIDIGCGSDLIGKDGLFPGIVKCDPYDKRLGDSDAQYIHEHRNNQYYDFVYSSHCLEHMANPFIALKNWSKLVKPGGYLIFVVPDEDLYEQGVWPSTRNKTHTHSFTIHKAKSWSPKSVNVLDLAKSLDNFQTIRISLQDQGYNYNIKGVDQTLGSAECNIEYIARKYEMQ